MLQVLVKTSILVNFMSHFAESRVVIQSDNIGETLDGPGPIAINNLNYTKAITDVAIGAKVIWDQNFIMALPNATVTIR